MGNAVELSRDELLNAIENALSNDEICIEQYESLVTAFNCKDYTVIKLDCGLFAIIVEKKHS